MIFLEKVPFTFQTILHKNGDIIFAYKDVRNQDRSKMISEFQIPTNITTVSDVNHPVKLGISDAYLFQHVIPGNNGRPKV